MVKNFEIDELIESVEIQESYDQRDYFNAVLKLKAMTLVLGGDLEISATAFNLMEDTNDC